MKFEESIKLLMVGKKVRFEGMSKDVYLFGRNGRIFHRGLNETEEEVMKCQPFRVFDEFWWEKNWEEVEEQEDWNFYNVQTIIKSDLTEVKKLKQKILEDMGWENINPKGVSMDDIRGFRRGLVKAKTIVNQRFGF